MPELPEVETVRKILIKEILKRRIVDVKVNYENIIDYPSLQEFKKNIVNQSIVDVKRRGKWLLFELNDYYLLSHLRMEGRYYYKAKFDIIDKHEHIIFYLDNDYSLRYKDVRKFGKMYLVLKDRLYIDTPLKSIGLEPWDDALTSDYLINKYKNKTTVIKTMLLDQTIISGIGNIYANEILFYSRINPYKKSCDLNRDELNEIIKNTRKILELAIEKGGTTIRTYESSLGITGLFQNELKVHDREGLKCYNCESIIKKDFINGRGTYYCEKCQNVT